MSNTMRAQAVKKETLKDLSPKATVKGGQKATGTSVVKR